MTEGGNVPEIKTPEVAERPERDLCSKNNFQEKFRGAARAMLRLNVPNHKKPGFFAEGWPETDPRFKTLTTDAKKKELLTFLDKLRQRVFNFLYAANIAEALDYTRQGKLEEAQKILDSTSISNLTTPEDLKAWYRDEYGNELPITYNPNTLTFEGIIDETGQKLPPIGLKPTDLIFTLEELGENEKAEFLKNHLVLEVKTDEQASNSPQEMSYKDFENLLETQIKNIDGLLERMLQKVALVENYWNNKITGFKFICAAETPSVSSVEEKTVSVPALPEINQKVTQLLREKFKEMLKELRQTNPSRLSEDEQAEWEAKRLKAWETIYWSLIQPKPEADSLTQRTILALKLEQLGEDHPQTEEIKKQLGVENHRQNIVDFLNQQLQASNKEPLSPAETELVIKGSFDLSKLVTANKDKPIQNSLQFLSECLKEESDVQTFNSLLEKFDDQVFESIKQQLLDNFNLEITEEAKKIWQETEQETSLIKKETLLEKIKKFMFQVDKGGLLFLLLSQSPYFFFLFLPEEIKEELKR